MAVLTCGDDGSSGQAVIAQINANTTAIDALESLVSFTSDVRGTTLGVPETYTEIGALSATLESGQYVIHMSAAYAYDQINASVYQRFTINGVTEEFRREPKDTTDKVPQMYGFPLTWAGGAFTANMEIRKESATGTLDVSASAMWIEKKAELA